MVRRGRVFGDFFASYISASHVQHISDLHSKFDNRKTLVKQQYLLHMSSQYGELRPVNGWDRFRRLRHPGKFQQVSRLAFVTAATSLTGGQSNFAWCLAVSWLLHYMYNFGGCCPLAEFCLVQNSLCVQVLRSPILPAWVYGTRAAAVSQTLWRGARNGITELSQRAPPVFGWAAMTLGIGPHASFIGVQKPKPLSIFQ